MSKARGLEAMRKCDNDPVLLIAIARVFWAERNLEKTMTWFEKAIVSDSDYGDGWAYYYNFLMEYGTEVSTSRYPVLKHSANIRAQEKRADVVTKCVTVEPKHGEVWQSISKDPANTYKTTEEILHMVANQLK